VIPVRNTPSEVHGSSPAAGGAACRRLRWENRSRRRYYQAVVQQDLFGGWEVWRTWGGLGSSRGGQLVVPSASEQAGLAELQTLATYRRRRGYLLVAGPDRGASGPQAVA
jgi:predicted DNA-binding WGR domain protein